MGAEQPRVAASGFCVQRCPLSRCSSHSGVVLELVWELCVLWFVLRFVFMRSAPWVTYCWIIGWKND